MAKCANCENNALYAYKINDSLSIDYCSAHLPKFLNAQKAAGLLKPVVAEPAPAPAKASKKKAEVVEEAPVEEAPVDDANN